MIYSRHGETADSVIARLAFRARTDGREVEIYSDDLEVKQSVITQGGKAQTTSQLEREVHAAPRDLERLSRHRMAMRRHYGLDATHMLHKDCDEDDNLPPRIPGKKKKRHR